jgi:alpha-L-fucosidase 2
MAPSLSWETPSGKSLHSIPLGNGEIGINAWVEPPGDVVFYVARTDAWSEQGRLLKLGRLRLSFDPAPFHSEVYRESLDLSSATVVVHAGLPGSQITVRLWVDAHLPVVRVEVTSEQPIGLSAMVELWRTEPRELTGEELQFGLHGGPHSYVEGPDTRLAPRDERLVWFHRNQSSVWSASLELQGLHELKESQPDPLLHRTFGCALGAEGLGATGDDTLRSIEPRKTWSIELHACTSIAPTVEDWLTNLQDQIHSVGPVPRNTARQNHETWWNNFWGRSWIHLTGSPEAERVAESYRLQRYYNACAGRGNFPIKFNGSLFTVDHAPFNPDYRRWGGGYWFQNTRLPYWSMLASGDFSFCGPFFRLFESQLALARFRTQKYFGHEGAYFGETQTFWGTYQNFDFGWDGKAAQTGAIENPFIRWHLNGNLELLALMLSYYDFTQDEAFAKTELVPMATELLRFFDQHYRRDDKGRLRLEPGQSLETYWDALNNTPDIAGLRFVLERLLNLPDEIRALGPSAEWQRLQRELPEIPMEDAIGEPRILPAEKFGKMTNYENPELYAIFPFRVFGVGRANLPVAQNSYKARRHCSSMGWSQDEIHAAFAGLGKEAQRGLIERFSTRGFDRCTRKALDEVPRFPAVWGPNFDWLPDMDHGASAMIALQSMLLQGDAETIHVLPAWPADWDVDFKLWAPGQTQVSGSVRSGRLASLKVTPQSDKYQVVVHDPQ